MTLILHIGAPKTATTTLQHIFFPEHRGILFLGRGEEPALGVKTWWHEDLAKIDDMLEMTNLGYTPDRSRIAGLVAEARVEAAGRPMVLSSGNLSVFSGVFPEVKLRRVKELFGSLGPIRIVYGIREQFALIKSMYVTDHRDSMLKMPGRTQTWYPDFDRYLDIQFRYCHASIFESFRFSAMLDMYEEAVGSENLFVYSFDDLRRDPVVTLKRLCHFMDIADDDPCVQRSAATKDNQHHTARAYALTRLRWYLTGGRGLGPLVPSPVKTIFRRWLNQGARFDFTPSSDAIRRIREYYRADNEALFAKRGIRL